MTNAFPFVLRWINSASGNVLLRSQAIPDVDSDDDPLLIDPSAVDSLLYPIACRMISFTDDTDNGPSFRTFISYETSLYPFESFKF